MTSNSPAPAVDPAPMTKARPDRVGLERPRARWAITLTLVVVGLLGSAAWARLGFGSISAALAYLDGDHLVVDASSRSFGTTVAGGDPEVVFVLKNVSRRSVQIVGVSASCTCLIPSPVPLTIAAAAAAPFPVSVRTRQRSGPLREHLTLFMDDPTQPTLRLSISGLVDVGSAERGADPSLKGEKTNGSAPRWIGRACWPCRAWLQVLAITSLRGVAEPGQVVSGLSRTPSASRSARWSRRGR